MISICLYLLYLQVGLSFLAGLAFCIVVIAINQVLTVLISRVFKKYMDCKDERIKMMSEILAGIRVIKLYAWERIFKNKVSIETQSIYVGYGIHNAFALTDTSHYQCWHLYSIILVLIDR